ncbi:MAG: hypothetical protein ABI863_10435 [Ginsengibacter sp.]
MNTLIMETTVLSEEMLAYFSRLNREEQQSVPAMVKTFINSPNKEFGTVTLDEYNRELEEADAEIEAGDFVTHEEVKKKYLK